MSGIGLDVSDSEAMAEAFKHHDIVSKKFLQVLGIVLTFTLISLFLFRIMDFPLLGVAPKADIIKEMEVEFIERNRFDVAVFDKYGKLLAESTDGKNGFLGVLFNAVKRERIKKMVHLVQNSLLPFREEYMEILKKQRYDYVMK